MKKNQLKRKQERPDHIKPDTIQMQQPNPTQKVGEEGVYLRKFLWKPQVQYQGQLLPIQFFTRWANFITVQTK